MEDDIRGLLKRLAQEQRTLHARSEAMQVMLLATATARGKASPDEYAKVEAMVLMGAEYKKSLMQPEAASAFEACIEEMLTTVRTAVRSKAPG